MFHYYVSLNLLMHVNMWVESKTTKKVTCKWCEAPVYRKKMRNWKKSMTQIKYRAFETWKTAKSEAIEVLGWSLWWWRAILLFYFPIEITCVYFFYFYILPVISALSAIKLQKIQHNYFIRFVSLETHRTRNLFHIQLHH